MKETGLFFVLYGPVNDSWLISLHSNNVACSIYYVLLLFDNKFCGLKRFLYR